MKLRYLAVLAAVVATGTLSGAADPAQPNIVFILADDLGWTDLGCQGSRYYESPNIDKLTAGGMRFTNGYSCGPNCQPTRAALMSGQYGPRTGVYTVGGIERFDWKSRPLRPVDNVQKLPPDKATVAQPLKKAGYATALFGKWHLGQDDAHHPAKRGFDEAIVSMGKHFDFETTPKVDYPKGTYLADFLTDKAVDFIRRHKGGPFFLCLHHFGVHAPHDAKPELIERFKNKPGVGGHTNPTYAAMIASVDESVGRVVATLDELKLSEDTLVIFSSDNGGVGGYIEAGVKTKDGITNNAPLRGGKGMLYEGGVRVPYIFRRPGTIKPGTTCPEPINSVDLFPTFLDVAGAKPPDGQILDGESYKSLLLGDGTGTLKRDALYWHFPGYLGAGVNQWRTTPAGSVRAGDWKLIEFFETGQVELYNLAADLSEKKNLAAENPAKRDELHKKLVAWREAVKAPMPTPNKEKK